MAAATTEATGRKPATRRLSIELDEDVAKLINDEAFEGRTNWKTVINRRLRAAYATGPDDEAARRPGTRKPR